MTIEQVGFAVLTDEHLTDFLLVQFTRLLEVAPDFLLLDAVEDRRSEFESQEFCRPAQVRLEKLPDVHARRHAQRVEHDVHGCSVREEREVFLGHNLGNDALVPVAAGHFVTN